MKWSESRSVVSNSLQPHGLHRPWNSPGKSARVGSLSLLQGIFPTQGFNPGLPHCRQILYQLSYQGSPNSLLRSNNIPLHGYITFYPFIHWWTLGCFYLSAVVNNAAVNSIIPLVVQRLRLWTPNAGGLGSIPGQGTESHMPQQRICMLQPKWSCVLQLRPSKLNK